MQGLFLQKAFEDPIAFISWVVLVVFSICVHEYAHAATADRLGDDTAAMLGHLTLNPLKQMGALSLVMLAVLGFAWGQVPVNPSRLRGGTRSEALVAAAGPLSNLWLSFAFLLLFILLLKFGDPVRSQVLLGFLATGALLNMMLCLFNLIPAPPLDGWKILTCFVHPLRNIDPRMLAQASNLVLIVLLLSGIVGHVFRVAADAVTWLLPVQDQAAFLLALSR
jgi:Zn-dependent protease